MKSFTAHRLYSLKDLSRVLRGAVTADNVRRLMETVPPDGWILRSSKRVRAWHLETLPGQVARELERIRGRLKHDHVHQVFGEYSSLWQPPVPIAEVPAKWMAEAEKLRKALAATLQISCSNTVSEDELLDLAAKDYAKICGREMGRRQLTRWLDRVRERDAGAHAWHNLALYLDERVFRRTGRGKGGFDQSQAPEHLRGALANVRDKCRLTPGEEALVFHACFERFEFESKRRPAGRSVNQIKSNIIAQLYSALPSLAASFEALRKNFNRKLERWRNGGGRLEVIKDGRHKSRAMDLSELEEDIEIITAFAAQYDCCLSFGHRQAIKQGKLSQRYLDHWKIDLRNNKSLVPEPVRREVKRRLVWAEHAKKGAGALRVNGPRKMLDWSGILPGDYYVADDVTYEHLVAIKDGRGWKVRQVETLCMVDAVSDYLVAANSIAGNYNATHIQKLLRQAHDDFGLPRNGLIFERGIWKSKQIAGSKRRGESLPYDRFEAGLNKLGLWVKSPGESMLPPEEFEPAIRHARVPQGKTIEGVFKRMQMFLKALPNAIGSNARLAERKDLLNYAAKINRGTAELDPQKILPYGDFLDRVGRYIDELNNEPVKARKLRHLYPHGGGVSPAEAMMDTLKKHPLRKLPEEARYLLATVQRRVRINRDGQILLTFHGEQFLYDSPETVDRQGEEVLVYFDIDDPSILNISDVYHTHMSAVPLNRVRAYGATREELSQANAAHRQWSRRVREVNKIMITHPAVSTISRDDLQDEGSRMIGEMHLDQVQSRSNKSTSRSRLLAKVRKVPGVGRIDDNCPEGELREILAAHEEEKQILRAARSGKDELK